MLTHSICRACGNAQDGPSGRCLRCGGVALVAEPWRNVENAPPTPLVRSRVPGIEGLLLKVEGTHHSGSFKDRVMGVLVADAVARGTRAAVVASSGNAAVAAASACARAGLPLLVLVPDAVSANAVRMVTLRGATVVRAGEGPAAVHGLATALAATYPLANLASTFGAAGCEWACRGIGHEIAGQVPGDLTAVAASISVGPVLVGTSNGLGEAGRPPVRLLGAQAAACAPIASAYASGAERVMPWTGPADTKALAIADRLTGYADEATFALSEVRRSGGYVGAVSDEEMRVMREDLARHDGLDVELASCAAPALLRLRGEDVTGAVCVLTGSGVKETLAQDAPPPATPSLAEFVARAGLDDRIMKEVDAWVRSSR